ncbi:MAG: hypothetical protein QOH10_1374, partial [Actinomycetota bacterium]|nr:hypothetical protein [Actinomycetota bacterium]
FSAAIAGGGVAGFVLGGPGSSSAATAGGSTTTTNPGSGHSWGFGRRGAGGMGGGFDCHGGLGLDAAAKAIGISTATLRADLEGGKTIAQIAKSKGVAVKTVIDAMVAAAKTEIDADVKAGHLTADQAAKLKADLTQMITDRVNGTFTRPDAPGGPDGPHRGFGFRGGFGLDAAAKAIGVSTDTLLTDLRSGKTIAQVAKSKGVATKTVIDAMLAAAKAEFDAQVKAGRLTAAQAARIEANLTQMITDQVNGTFKRPDGLGGLRGGPGGYGGFGPGGYGGFGGPGLGFPGGDATTSSAPTI